MRAEWDSEWVPKNLYCNFGLTEVGIPALIGAATDALGGIGGALGIGAGAADAGAAAAGAGALGAGAADAAAITLPEIEVGASAGALGAGELGAADAAAIGAGAAGAVPNILIPAAAGGGGIGDLIGGLGAAGSAALGAFGATPAAAGELSPNAIVNGEFNVVNNGIQSGDIQPTGGNMPNSFNIPTPQTATGAGSASAPAGVTPPVGVDPTASLDNLAAGGTPSGGVSGAGTVPQAGAAPNVGGATGATSASTTPQAFSFDNLIKDAGASIMKNPIGTALGAGGLLYSVMSQNQISSAQKTLEQQAASLDGQGQALMNYLTSGKLPPGLKASLDQATAAAKARVISNYANQGLNTNPTENSALAQQLAMIDQQSVISIAQIGQQLFTSGLQETGLSSSLYSQLVQIDATQTANIGKAIASFAAAVSPSKGLTLNLGGSKAA